jgi:hypothetical protein
VSTQIARVRQREAVVERGHGDGESDLASSMKACQLEATGSGAARRGEHFEQRFAAPGRIRGDQHAARIAGEERHAAPRRVASSLRRERQRRRRLVVPSRARFPARMLRAADLDARAPG